MTVRSRDGFGDSVELGTRTVTRDELVAFA